VTVEKIEAVARRFFDALEIEDWTCSASASFGQLDEASE
jgi:hypothetical protein